MRIGKLLSIVTLLIIVSCAKESDIEVRDMKNASPFEFPQGDSPADKKLYEIYEKYGIICIYKGFGVDDLNKSWSSGSTGETGIKGSDIADERLLNFNATFFSDNIFKYFTPEITKGIFPPYIYFVNNFYESVKNPFFGNAGFPNSKEYYGKPLHRFFTGLGFWGFSFVVEYVNAQGLIINVPLPATQLDYFKFKEITMKNIFDMMLKKNRIVKPKFLDADVALDLDYVTMVKSSDKESADLNFYKRRGFPETLRNLTNYATPSSVSNSGNKVNITPQLLFNDYIWLGLRYSKAQIEINYKEYPLVIKYYNKVAEYLLTSYSIDLNAMSELPSLIE